MKVLAAKVSMVLATAWVAAQADPYTGIWILNLAKSGGDSRTQTLTIAVVDNQETYRSEMVWANGTRQVTSYVAAYDGKEHPSRTVVTESSGESRLREDTVILEKIDERTRERRWKQGGRVVRILRRVVSPEGKTLTSRVVDVDEQGRERATSTLVFEKR